MTVIRTLGALLATAVVLLFSSAPAGAATDAQDETWMVAAHQGNLAEIAAGHIAVDETKSEAVRRLGQMLIDDHTRLDADLQAVADQEGVTLPAEPTEQQQASAQALQAIHGGEFDRIWVSTQIGAHRTAIAAATTEQKDGSDPTVVALAVAATPAVQQHLDALLAQTDQNPQQDGGESGGSPAWPYVVGIVAVIVVLAGAASLFARRGTRRRAEGQRH